MLKGLTANPISTDMSEVSGDHAHLHATICRRDSEFQRYRLSTEENHRSGRLVDTCIEDNDSRKVSHFLLAFLSICRRDSSLSDGRVVPDQKYISGGVARKTD